jgi:hypothetical protein
MTVPNYIIEILAGGSCLLIGAILYWLVTKKPATNVVLADVENAIKPYVLQAIFAGERIARQGLEDSRQVLEGADRKAIASYFYNLLPDTIEIFGISVKVRDFITQAYFDTLIENVLSEVDIVIKDSEAELDALVKSLPSANTAQG